MASTGLSHLLQTLSLPRVHAMHRTSYMVDCPKRTPRRHPAVSSSRRQFLFLLTLSTATTAGRELTATAEDIPLFGLRKKLKKIEEEGVEILEEGIETAEKGIEKAEEEIETVEREIETTVSFGGLAQAGAVVGAEVLGILVATSLINGILGPQGQKS